MAHGRRMRPGQLAPLLLLTLAHCVPPPWASALGLGSLGPHPLATVTQWDAAQASTMLPGANMGASMGSACGYGNMFMDGFGEFRAAASSALFGDGAMCGACFELKCNAKLQPALCNSGVTVNVTLTDQCYQSPFRGQADICGPKAKHFALPGDVYALLGKSTHAMLMPIQYRRVPCKRRGAITFQVNGNPQLLQVNIRNVGGSGTIKQAWVRARGTHGWLPMQRIWGENWVVAGSFLRRILSFKLREAPSNLTVVVKAAVPRLWQLGGIYSKGQFQS